MQLYEYKVVPAPARPERRRGLRRAEDRLADAVGRLMNEQAAEGWEYLRADALPCVERKGLVSTTTNMHTLLVFRRPVADRMTVQASAGAWADAAGPAGAAHDGWSVQGADAAASPAGWSQETAGAWSDAAAEPHPALEAGGAQHWPDEGAAPAPSAWPDETTAAPAYPAAQPGIAPAAPAPDPWHGAADTWHGAADTAAGPAADPADMAGHTWPGSTGTAAEPAGAAPPRAQAGPAPGPSSGSSELSGAGPVLRADRREVPAPARPVPAPERAPTARSETAALLPPSQRRPVTPPLPRFGSHRKRDS